MCRASISCRRPFSFGALGVKGPHSWSNARGALSLWSRLAIFGPALRIARALAVLAASFHRCLHARGSLGSPTFCRFVRGGDGSKSTDRGLALLCNLQGPRIPVNEKGRQPPGRRPFSHLSSRIIHIPSLKPSPFSRHPRSRTCPSSCSASCRLVR